MKTLLSFAVALAFAQVAAAVTPFPQQAFQGSDLAGHVGLGYLNDTAEIRPAGAFTLEAWVRADPNQALSGYPIAVTKPAGTLLNGDCTYGFVFERATGRVSFRVSTTVATYNATGAANLLDGAWHHIAGVRESGTGAQLRLVVDGVQVASVAVSGNNRYSTESLCVGGVLFAGYEGNSLVGQVDELRLWNVARTAPEIAFDRGREFNAAPGLLMVFHFDRAYTNDVGTSILRDSVFGGGMWFRNDAMLTGTGAPMNRGLGLWTRAVLGQAPGEIEHDYRGVVRLGGGRDLVHRTYWSFAYGYGSELDVVDATGSANVLGRLQLPVNGPITGMAARDSVAFCLRMVPGQEELRVLFPVRVGSSGVPVQFGDSVVVKSVGSLALDTANPNQLTLAGTSGTDDVLSVFDVSNAGAPVLQLEWPLGDRTALGTLIDVARRGAYHFASFSDGSLRGYRYESFTLNGITFKQFVDMGVNLAPGDSSHVMIVGTRLYVLGVHGVLRAYDISTPTAPVPLSALTFANVRFNAMAADGDRLALAGPNGVMLVDASNPTAMKALGDYCDDMPASGAPSVSLGNGIVGLTSGRAGYSSLGTAGVLAVDPGVNEAALVLRAQPNPARGTTWFTVPAGLGTNARLDLYDARGRQVRSLDANAGRIAWDGTDENGGSVSAGIYFARVSGLSRSCEARIVRLR